jgi:glutathione peroxidase
LVDRSGQVVGRFHHRTKPASPEVVNEIERVLAAK